MNIQEVAINDLREYANNPRNNNNAIEAVAESIKQFGWKVPIVIDKNKEIVAGHTRYKAALQLGFKSVPCIIADDLTDEQIRAFRLADNKTAELAEWDFEALEQELLEIDIIDMHSFGFDDITFGDIEDQESYALEEHRETLREKFIVPPFSVLDTKQGQWQERKNLWKSIIKSDEGRAEGLLGKGLQKLAEKHAKSLTGTSIFDPVLCEILINWFCPVGGKILDPFAGGSVRGLISVLLGNEYTGIDLREEQIEANKNNYKILKNQSNLLGNELSAPTWIVEDSTNIDKIISEKHDFLLTCPPYADLEVYSDDPRDISTMPYEQFKEVYFDIIKKSCDLLNDNAFAAIVVGEVRSKQGDYYNFVSDTIEAFKQAGLRYYNECILLNSLATAAVRAERQFNSGRKVVKIHQNVLIFVKGDEKEILKRLQKYEYKLEDDAPQ